MLSLAGSSWSVSLNRGGMMISLSLSLVLSHSQIGRVWMRIILFLCAPPSSSHFSHFNLHRMALNLNLSRVLELSACCLQNVLFAVYAFANLASKVKDPVPFHFWILENQNHDF